jgi:hypothetical protein
MIAGNMTENCLWLGWRPKKRRGEKKVGGKELERKKR